MKKIYYLLAFVAVAFTACQKQPIVPLYPNVPSQQTLNITLAASDYALLPSTAYPSQTLTFDDADDAQNYIPTILNAKYSSKVAADGSTATVTYATSPLYFKPAADSLYSDVYYTLTPSDYLLLPNNKYTDFSLAQAQAWLPYKYTSPVNNQLVLLNFTPYPATLTPPYSFIYFNSAWRLAYTISPAQYTSVGLGKYDEFTTSNTEASLVSTFNFFLKNDVTIMDTIKKGDYEFVSFNYYVSSSQDYQRVKPLQYNGTDFVVPFAGTASLSFAKKNGTWAYVQPLPVINYTLTAADITTISNSTFGTSALRSNLASYGDFETSWATADLQGAFILCLTTDFPSPQTNTIYKVHYLLYSGGSDVDSTLSFIWDGTKWVAQ